MPSFRSLVAKLYLYTFLYDLIFAYPIYAVLFQSRGMSVLQISMLLMWWNISAGLLEMPTGALADHWSRRNMLVIAPLAKMTCFVIWYLADGSFFLFALGFTFWSIGGSFQSGTLEAMLYDGLLLLGCEGDYEKVRGRQRVCRHLALGAAEITGGLLAYYSMNWALLLSAAPLAMAFLVAVTMREPPRAAHVADNHYFAHFRNAWREFRHNRSFRYALAYQMLAVGVLGEMDEYDPLYYTLLGVPLYALGWLQATRAVAEALGNLAAHRLKRLAIIEPLAPLLIGVLLVLVGLFPCKAMAALIILSYLILSPVEVIIEGKMQNSMRTASRATVLSGASLFGIASGIPLMTVFGALAKWQGLGAGYVFFGIVLLLFSLWVPRRARHSVPASLK
jgi:MFS family permease